MPYNPTLDNWMIAISPWVLQTDWILWVTLSKGEYDHIHNNYEDLTVYLTQKPGNSDSLNRAVGTLCERRYWWVGVISVCPYWTAGKCRSRGKVNPKNYWQLNVTNPQLSTAQKRVAFQAHNVGQILAVSIVYLYFFPINRVSTGSSFCQ